MPGYDRRTVNIKGDPLKFEYTCAVALTVGMVVEDGPTPGTVVLSSATGAGSGGGKLVVAEAPERGKGIFSTGTTESTYLPLEQVACLSLIPGNEVLVLLKAAQVITRGGELDVEAASGLVVTAAGTARPAFTALETLTATGQNQLIHVRVL